MDDPDLEEAEKQLVSLLDTCEAVLARTTLSPSRTTLMTRRTEALRVAVQLVRDARAASES